MRKSLAHSISPFAIICGQQQFDYFIRNERMKVATASFCPLIAKKQISQSFAWVYSFEII